MRRKIKIRDLQLIGSVKIALVVGVILSSINQYDVYISGEIGVKEVVKTFLNFVVPFSVATYSKIQFIKNSN